MQLDEFLIAIGVKADTKPAEKMADAIDDVADSAKKADVQVNSFGSRMAGVFKSALSIVGAAAVAIQASLLGAFAFFDSYIGRAEELYNSKNEDIKITKEQYEQSKQYQEGLGTLGKIIDSVKVKVAFGFLPVMLQIVNTFNKFLAANKDLIANGISKLLTAISYAAQVIMSTIRFITLIIERTIGWKGALLVVAAAFIYLRRAMLLAFITNPIFWVIAAIGVLLILIDDFMTYLDGGESEFGEFWGAMLEGIDSVLPALQKIWDMLVLGMSYLIEFGFFITKYLGGAFVDVVEVIVAALAFIYGVFTGNTALMSAAWDGLIENLVSAFRNFAMLFEPLAQSIIAVFRAMVSGIASALSTAYVAITTPFRLAFDWIMDKFSKLPSLIGNIISKLPGVNAISAIGSAVSSGVSRVTNNYGGNTTASINVTAPNATSAANQTAAALQGAQAQRNLGGQALA